MIFGEELIDTHPLLHNVLPAVDPDDNFLNSVIGDLGTTNKSKYYSIDEYNSTFNSTTLHADFMTYNARSYNKNKDPFIAMLKSLSKMPEIIVLTETWLTPDETDQHLLDGYTEYHTARPTGRGGGVSLLCWDTIGTTHIPELSICSDTIESCVVEINFEKEKFIVFALYRPHSDTIENFNGKLLEMLLSDRLRGMSVVLLGDVKVDLLKQESLHIASFIDIMQSVSFIPLISIATRFPPAGSQIAPSLLDHIWLNKLCTVSSGVICMDNTDHCPTFVKVPLEVANSDTIKLTFRIHNRNSINNLKQKVNTLVANIDHEGDVDYATSKFISDLNNLYRECFPLTTKYVSSKRLRKPWISSGIINSIKTKSRYFKLYKQGIIDEQLNRKYRNCLNATIRQAKKNYYVNTFNSCQSNIKKTWELIKHLLSKKSKSSTIRNIIVNNSEISENSEIAEHLNNYFADIPRILNNQIATSNTNPYDSVKVNQTTSAFFYPVSACEVETIIQNLKNTSNRINEIPVKLLKELASIISGCVANLVNASICSGIFPECLKYAKIVPIHKKGDPKNMSNYRPIALLPTISKIFEKCISTRLLHFFTKSDSIFPRQFGFLKGRSTADAFLALVEYIYNCLNNKEHCIGIFIDLTKAFDTVNHGILLGKLERYGVRGLPLRLLSSYLKDRKHSVTINGYCSSQRIINVGVPQGSILGPWLFLIYINDLPNISSIFWSILYADDTTLLANDSNYSNLVHSINNELSKLHQWTTSNRLSISLDKTYSMLFTNREGCIENEQIYLNNEMVKNKTSEDFLGLIIDNKLKFETHILGVCKKLSRTAGLLFKLKSYVPCKVLVNLYYSLVYPYLVYANLVWGGICSEHLMPLVTLQKRILRIINNSEFLAHTNPLFKKNNILKLSDVHNFILAQYMFKRKQCNDVMFQRIHEYDTRGGDDAQQAFQRLTQTQRSVYFVGPQIWNSLPNYIRESDSLKVFRKQLKRYYTSKHDS